MTEISVNYENQLENVEGKACTLYDKLMVFMMQLFQTTFFLTQTKHFKG